MKRLDAWMTPQRMLWASVLVALVTIALKTGAWWLTDSVGLLSDAMESLVNLASAMFGLLMVTVAERPADEDVLAPELEVAVALDPALLPPVGVVEFPRPLDVLARARRVRLRRHAAAERVVRALVVQPPRRLVEPPLLRGEPPLGRPRGLGAKVAVHALVARVVLGMPGARAGHLDVLLHPPDAQRGEPAEAVRGEGPAVVGVDPLEDPLRIASAVERRVTAGR